MTRIPPLLPLLLLSLLLLAPSCTHATSDVARLDRLSALQTSSRDGLLHVSIADLRQFLESTPRSYHLFLLLTAPPNLCQPCAAMARQYAIVASDYAALPASKRASKPVFFLHTKVTMDDQPFLQAYGISHVPILHYVPPGSSRFPVHLESRHSNNYPVQEVGFAANSIKGFVNGKVKSKFRIVRANYQIPFKSTVKQFRPLIVFIVAAFSVAVLRTSAYQSPMLWFALVVLVYIFSVGGGHYSWIHDTPLAVVNKEGRMEYIAGGSRSQYVAEGFFVSATCVSISVLVIMIQELPAVVANKHGQTAMGMGLVMLTVLAISALLATYNLKMPQYLTYSELS